MKINIGSVNLVANHNITQIIDVCDEHEKSNKLFKLLSDINANDKENKTIIFAETKRKVDELSNQMKSIGWFEEKSERMSRHFFLEYCKAPFNWVAFRDEN